jgi:predicted nucleotidyltransferase
MGMRKIRIRLNKQKIDNFCRKYHIVYLALFGSVLTPKFTEKSDIDVLVKFEKKHVPHLLGIVRIESELSEILGRSVDLKTPNDLSPYFRDEVLAIAKTIYGK